MELRVASIVLPHTSLVSCFCCHHTFLLHYVIVCALFVGQKQREVTHRRCAEVNCIKNDVGLFFLFRRGFFSSFLILLRSLAYLQVVSVCDPFHVVWCYLQFHYHYY